MINQVTLTTSEGKSFQANECDLSTDWVLVHNGTKVLNVTENKGVNRGKLVTINSIFEGDTKDELIAEANRLSLTGCAEAITNYEKRSNGLI